MPSEVINMMATKGWKCGADNWMWTILMLKQPEEVKDVVSQSARWVGE